MKNPILILRRIVGLCVLACSLTFSSCSAQSNKTRLLIRIDDMGFSHAANVACLETYKSGIARSVEVIVPGPWFEEAAQMLREHPELDAGVHLVLTSEWSNLKWRPLTQAPSLVDEDGYFFPMIWQNQRFPELGYLKSQDWVLSEIEAEWRAQIELAKKKIPQLSHLSDHMGCRHISPATKNLFYQLAKEYGLDIHWENLGVKGTPSWSGNQYSAAEKEGRFIEMLENLGPGDWLVVEHPGYDVPELQTVGHKGYENVGVDRDGVTKVFLSKKVAEVLQKSNIELISYKDLK
ncbi:MAG: ChbG/HpnK family deacetylase [Saprospiraceae bacterium]|nr:ChbG/HpnK family deacetylase [Saprospiraceae bacterium]